MPEGTPAKTGENIYECLACGNRTRAEHQPLECSNCGGLLQNLSKSRE